MKMPLELERMMFGFIESQVLFVCDEYRIFNYLHDNGSATADEIAINSELSSSALERILIVATSMGLLEKNMQKYSVSSKWLPYLIKGSSQYCGGKFTHYFKMSYGIFEYLRDAIKENKPQWYKMHNINLSTENTEDVYNLAVYKDETTTREFLDTMWSSGYTDSIDLCNKYSFFRHNKLVDLGGATGSFAIAALQNNVNLQAIVMDCQKVKPYAIEKFQELNVSDRMEFHVGNMFTDILPEGDIYVLGYVLSDWSEHQCVSLVHKIYQYLPLGGKIVILEKFFNEDKTGPYLTSMLNITMLLEMYGTHRTVSEYSEWLTDAGFKHLNVTYSSGEKHMLVGSKV